MKIIAKKNRKLALINAQNTQNENRAETIELVVPEEYENYSKKIVFITSDGNVWDVITNNEYKITNAITKYEQVDFYIWLTKEVDGESIDFRTETKTLSFYHNVDASEEITDEEIHGVNTVVNLLEEEIEKVENLNIEATKIGGTTTVTITKKDGTTESVEINDGTDGQDGRDGQDGQDGYTPQKGIDYFTEQDIEEIEGDILNEVYTKEQTDTLLQGKADIEDIPDVSNFITASVNNLVNYYLKSDTYNKTEVDTLLSTLKTGIFEVVSVLPTPSQDTLNIIYLVPSSNPKTQNIKDEYLTIPLDNGYVWENIGSTAIDLSGYATESWVNTQISDFLTEIEIQQLINTAVNQKYTKPALGIPKTDLASDVQTSLGKADTALQEHQDISGKEDKTNKVTSIDNTSTDTQYPSAKCVYDSQATQDDEIEALQTENERLKATLPTTTGEGQDITLNKTAEMEFVKPPLPRGNSEQESTTGKNLLEPNGAPTTIRGVSWSYREDGAVVGTRVSSNENVSDFTVMSSNTFQPGSYIYSCFDSESTPGASKYQSNISINGASYWGTGNYSFVLNEVSTIRVVLRVYPSFTGTAIFKPMIRLSSIQESNYEPYTGGQPSPNPDYPQEIRNVTGDVEVVVSNADSTKSQTFTFPLGNEKLMLGDYLADDGIHHVRGEYVFTGSETTFTNFATRTITCRFTFPIPNKKPNTTSISEFLCNIGQGVPDYYWSRDEIGVCELKNPSYASIIFSLSNNEITDLNSAKSYFANKYNNNEAITVEYELATEEITPYTAEQQQVYNLIKKALSYEEQTNISGSSGESNPIFDVEAYQSTKLILENLDSRLTLVEG